MSRTLTTHVSLWDESGAVVTLAPGDEVPGWAESKVGNHCLTLPGNATSEPGRSEAGDVGEVEAEVEEIPGPTRTKPAGAPDFTSAAPRRGRPRK